MNADILKFILSDWPKATAEINKAGPYEILFSFLAIVLAVYVFINCLVFFVYRPNRLAIPETIRKLPQLLALSFGSIGLLLTVLDSRPVPLERDYSSERRQISQEYAKLKSALSGAVKGCDKLEFSDLSIVKEEAIARLYSCAFKNEFNASLPDNYSFLLSQPKVLTANNSANLDVLLKEAVTAVASDYERALRLSEKYLSAHVEFGVDEDNPIVVGLKELPNKIDAISEKVQSSSAIFADQIINDDAVRSFKSQTMLFILLMLLGLAIELSILMPLGKWLKELRIKHKKRKIEREVSKRGKDALMPRDPDDDK